MVMFVAGIALSQAMSDPRQVTLRWLRLGGLIEISLLTVAGVVWTVTGEAFGDDRGHAVVLKVCSVGLAFAGGCQLMLVQRGWRLAQRIAATVGFLTGAVLLGVFLLRYMPGYGGVTGLLAGVASCAPASGLLGGMLMTMLLGHAYLTAGGEMTQDPFKRLVVMLGVLVILRLVLSVSVALWPWWNQFDHAGFEAMWDTVMIVARYLVGLIVPGVFIYMTYDCVRRRSNQSATGILYVAGVLVILGEGAALALLKSTGLPF